MNNKGDMPKSIVELTVQDEQFVQLLLQGVSHYDAFIQLKPHATMWQRNSVDSRASRWVTKITPRLEEVRAKLAESQQITHETVLAEYTVAGFAVIVDSPTYADKHAGLRGIRDMLGYDAPKKTEEATRSLSVELKAELGAFTIEELRIMLRELQAGDAKALGPIDR